MVINEPHSCVCVFVPGLLVPSIGKTKSTQVIVVFTAGAPRLLQDVIKGLCDHACGSPSYLPT